MRCFLHLLWSVVSSWARPVDLHAGNFKEAVDGKHIFVLYSEHKRHRDIERAWTRLGEQYKEHDSVLIGFVDCGADLNNKKLCRQHHVTDPPMIFHYKADEWEQPERRQQYVGPRDFESLRSFVEVYVKRPREENQDTWKRASKIPQPPLKEDPRGKPPDMPNVPTQPHAYVKRKNAEQMEWSDGGATASVRDMSKARKPPRRRDEL